MDENRSNDPFNNREQGGGHEPKRGIPKINILILVVIIGLLIFGAVSYFGGFFGGGGHGNMPEQGFSTAFNNLSRLDVSLANSNINITTHSGNDVIVNFNPPTMGRYSRPNLEWDSNAGILRVYQPRGGRFVIFGSTGGGSLTISVPAASAHVINDAHVRTTNGNVDIRGLAASGIVEARTTNGRVNLDDISANEIIGRSTNGRVDANRLDSVRDTMLRTTNGAASFHTGSVGGHLTVRSTNGAVTVTNVDFSRANSDIRTTNGRVVID